jgi:hypothetical protein
MKREGGGCTPIIVALIGALGIIIAAILGGPLVEKWLDQNNNTPTNNGGGGNTTIQGGSIGVSAVADPFNISVGQMTEIRVQTLDSSGAPLAGVAVTVQAGGGTFLATGKTTVSGVTGTDGYFRTPWQCNPCAGGYVMDVTATKPNYDKGSGVVSVSIH